MDGSTLVLQVGCFGEQKWPTGESTCLPPYYMYVGWVCCWFSLLLQEVFLRILQFSSLLKNKHFQIPVRCGMHRHPIIIILNTILRTPKCDPKVKLPRFWIWLKLFWHTYGMVSLPSFMWSPELISSTKIICFYFGLLGMPVVWICVLLATWSWFFYNNSVQV